VEKSSGGGQIPTSVGARCRDCRSAAVARPIAAKVLWSQQSAARTIASTGAAASAQSTISWPVYRQNRRVLVTAGAAMTVKSATIEAQRRSTIVVYNPAAAYSPIRRSVVRVAVVCARIGRREYVPNQDESAPHSQAARRTHGDPTRRHLLSAPSAISAFPDPVSLWGLRLPIAQGFDQYANMRPARVLPGVKSASGEAAKSTGS
jgi:hypothetical protein